VRSEFETPTTHQTNLLKDLLLILAENLYGTIINQPYHVGKEEEYQSL